MPTQQQTDSIIFWESVLEDYIDMKEYELARSARNKLYQLIRQQEKGDTTHVTHNNG